MTGKNVQSRIRDINPLAEWVPCAAHTLNHELVQLTSAFKLMNFSHLSKMCSISAQSQHLGGRLLHQASTQMQTKEFRL